MFDIDALNEDVCCQHETATKRHIDKHSKMYTRLTAILSDKDLSPMMSDDDAELLNYVYDNLNDADDDIKSLVNANPTSDVAFHMASLHNVIMKMLSGNCRFDARDKIFIANELSGITTEDHPLYAAYKVPNKDVLQRMVFNAPVQMNLNWIDVSGIEKFDYVFFEKLFGGDISLWKFDSATSLDCMFHSAKLNYAVDITKWKFPKVKTARAMFSHAHVACEMNGWEFPEAEDMSYMFSHAFVYTEIFRWKFPKIKSVIYMFSGAKMDSSIARWDVPDNCSILEMFNKCEIKNSNKPRCLAERNWGEFDHKDRYWDDREPF